MVMLGTKWLVYSVGSSVISDVLLVCGIHPSMTSELFVQILDKRSKERNTYPYVTILRRP